ncbi:hypothetical protein OG896_01845 [Streptomyces sp. NBC_00669]|uniref:hypothetical protein n=1 Tax=unclassified Streptomyces TaxID=2593676 RepID=UPI002E3606E7|nr:hypothetical protein [Streptomyces sp. NBC_00669]
MSLRWRKSLSIAGCSLAIDVFLVAYWRWGMHDSWASTTRLDVVLLVFTAATTAYTWWWYGDPRREERVRRLRRERDERARLR